jgi:hypothetical protein
MLIPSRIFIILTSVLAGILMIGTLKNVKDLLILIKILILFVFVFKKSVIVHSWILSHIPIHFSIIIEQYWDIQTWKSLECVILYIGIHNSYQFTHDNFKYRYILSVNIISFWNVRCSLGNIYILNKKRDEHEIIFFYNKFT